MGVEPSGEQMQYRPEQFGHWASFFAHRVKGRDRRHGVEQRDSLNIIAVFGGVPHGVVPEEIVKVPDAVNVEIDVLSQKCFYFRFVVQAAYFHGRRPFAGIRILFVSIAFCIRSLNRPQMHGAYIRKITINSVAIARLR
jgi:hypothetical protein